MRIGMYVELFPGTGCQGVPRIASNISLLLRFSAVILLRLQALTTPSGSPMSDSSVRCTIPKYMPSCHLSSKVDFRFPAGSQWTRSPKAGSSFRYGRPRRRSYAVLPSAALWPRLIAIAECLISHWTLGWFFVFFPQTSGARLGFLLAL